jgi:Holliday junction DNA helicase RuvA
MIEYIKGTIAELTPATVTIDTGGVAYLLNISINTYTGLQGQTETKLLVHENIREDAWSLYGFASERERELFRALIGVSGVGASTARVILSGFTTAELEQTIAGGDVKALKNVKGIGGKTAERIIVDLRDKIKPQDDTLSIKVPAANDVFDEAMAALVMLGYTRQQSQKALKKLFEADPTLKVENAIKKALALM